MLLTLKMKGHGMGISSSDLPSLHTGRWAKKHHDEQGTRGEQGNVVGGRGVLKVKVWCSER